MDHRQVALGFLGVAIQFQWLMRIAQRFDSAVNLRPSRFYLGAFGDVFSDEVGVGRTFAANIHDAEAKASGVNELFDRNSAGMMLKFCGDGFGLLALAHFHSSDDANLAVDPMFLTVGWPAHDAFVHFDRVLTTDAIAFWADHARPELVQDLKSSFVTGKAELPLKLESGLAGGLRRYQVSAPKPNGKRRMGRLHHCAGRQRSVGFALAATKDNGRTAWKSIRLALGVAFRANKTMGPTDRFKIFGAGGIVGENGLEFPKWRSENHEDPCGKVES